MKTLARIEEAFIAITLLVVTTVLFVNIVLRYGFSANRSWAEELIRYGMIWIAFVGGAVCFRRGAHVGVDFILSFVKGRGQLLIGILVNVASIIFMGFLFKYGMDLIIFTQGTGQITPSLQIPLFYIYLAIPVGAALSIIHLTIMTVQMMRTGEVPATQNVEL
ncbi:TRAP transporter small permease [Paenalkalicoccus suaedae]|uniref:TRAP transporter small permease n=1 Tax=Paenalkalicoccus suaedae TaxID=2592382 RepID=UPI00201BE466|nr:TRAP transporter small permease [Paenalkalicoccus suaedae]